MSRKKSVFIVIFSVTILFLTILFLRQCCLDEDARFDDYTQDLFRQEVSGNAITLHYTLKSPAAYRIFDTPTSLGQVSTDTAAMGAAAENALARLHTYNRSELSNENRLIYDLLEHTFTTSYEMGKYALYEEPLSPLTGTQSQLPILLSEYQFYSKDDVKIYLKLLKELPDYFQAILDFEKAKAELGLFMTSKRADAVIDECNTFINMGSTHYLHSTFAGRLDTLDLDAEEKNSYIKQNSACIEEYVFPAYELLKKGLSELRTTGENKYGLYYLPEGKDYYELLVENVTGSSRSIIELQTLTLKQITQDLNDMQDAIDSYTTELKDENSVIETSAEIADTTSDILEDSNPASILATLENKLDGNFPAPPNVDISIKYVDASMEEYLSPAFYLIPAIDNSNENVIYINPQHMTDDLTLFTTLAHEGYPGHLYQTTYFANTNPAPIRSLLGSGGYTEGWATYCEMISYYYAPVAKSEATIMQKNSSIMLGLYALADMGIHYEGWTLTDTIDFFYEYGLQDTGAISEIYDLIIGDPGNYLKYYIGYVEFLELKKDAIEEWGDEFSQERFHREILETGPVPFEVLRKEMKLGTG